MVLVPGLVDQSRLREAKPMSHPTQTAETAPPGGGGRALIAGMRVSLFGSATDTDPTQADPLEILHAIRDGEYAVAVAEIRKTWGTVLEGGGDTQTAKKAVDRRKKRLPAIAWSGTFTRRAKDALVQHSGLLCADLDLLDPDTIVALRDALRRDPHVFAVFESPTGSGLKILIVVPPQPDDAGHKRVFRAVESRFSQMYRVKLDPSGKDVSRLCFVSHDPGAWWNPEAQPLEVLPETPARSTCDREPEPGSTAPRASAVLGALVLPSGPVSISESARAIFSLIAPSQTMFWRGGALVELTHIDGVASLDLVGPEGFRTRVERFGPLLAWRSGGNGEPVLKPARMSRDDATAILASLEARELLPPVASVLLCPVIIESAPGEVSILGRGYHAENGGMLILAGEVVPQMPVKEAAAALQWLVAEFDFQTPGDRSRALAALITPALRLGGFLRGSVPIDVAEADQSQAGKGFRHNLVATLYGEKAYFVSSKQGGVGSVDESFAAALISGRPFICLDNFRGRMASENLESFLTCPSMFAARIPHRGEVLLDPKRFLLQMSSNGLEATRDLANRASICRIRKRPGFVYRDTLGELERRQSHFLGAVFAVVAEWIAAGKPRSEDRRHDFREWAQTLDWICRELLEAAPLMDDHEAAQERASNPALTWLRAVALVVAKEGRFGEALIASELVELAELAGIDMPGAHGADHDRAKRQAGILMRRLFQDGEQLSIDGFEVRRGERAFRKPSGDMDTARSYTFSKAVK